MPADAAAALDAELDALYAAPLAEFTARRDTLAKRLKIAGAAEESRRVKALRKPNTVAWAVNRLHLERGGLAEVEAAAGALREALASPTSPEERRAAIERRRRAVDDAVDTAARLLDDVGAGSASPDLRRRLERTILAIASGVRGDDEPRPGRLAQDLDPPGFEALTGLPLPATAGARGVEIDASPAAPGAPRRTVGERTAARGRATAGRTASGRPAPPRGAAPRTAVRPALEPARSAAAARDAERERTLRKVRAALDDAEAELERATAIVETTRARVTDAERAMREARERVDAARRELASARTRRDALRRELEQLRR